MADSVPPPTRYGLKPHHVGMLRLLSLTFQTYDKPPNGPLPPTFLLQMYRILLREISEVYEPKSYQELVAEISKFPMSDTPTAQSFTREYKMEFLNMQTPAHLLKFIRAVPMLFLEKDEDEDNTRFVRRSLFGYFCRRCFFNFQKMSFTGQAKLHHDYMVWVDPRLDPPINRVIAREEVVPSEVLTMDYQFVRTKLDRRPFATSDAYADFEKGTAVGDENVATENLRRFFEQHFHEGNDSGLRQHALLNLARNHYINQEYIACRKFLQEAVGVARTNNDKLTLQHCMSMLHRLPPLERGRKPILNDIQPDLHPLEVLHDVQKLIQISNQQPLTASFEKIIQAVGLYDHWIDIQQGPFIDAEQWGQHVVQSLVWGMHGNNRLAGIEENIVTAFTEVAGTDNNRVTVTLNRAYRVARQGDYQGAIASLLEPDVWSGLSINEYNSWANEIWHILVLRASRRRQDRQFMEYLRQRRPSGFYRAREYWFWSPTPLGSIIRDPLYEVMQMREVDQGHAWVESLLIALWHAEFQCRYGLYRTAIILLADIGLEFGMTKWCRKIIEEIMPQIIGGSELEQRALACFTFTRCIIAAGDSSSDALRECLPYLQIAEKDYAKLEILRSLQDVQYLLSIVYHNLGMEEERDNAAARHLATEEQRKEAATVVLEDWVTEVWDFVGEVGSVLAAR